MTEHIVFARPVTLTEERVHEVLAKRAKQQALKEMLDEQIMEAQRSQERSDHNINEHVNGKSNGKFVSRKLLLANKLPTSNSKEETSTNKRNHFYTTSSKEATPSQQPQAPSFSSQSKSELNNFDQLELQGTRLEAKATNSYSNTHNNDNNDSETVGVHQGYEVSNVAANLPNNRSKKVNDSAIKFNSAQPTRYTFSFENGYGEFKEEESNHANSTELIDNRNKQSVICNNKSKNLATENDHICNDIKHNEDSTNAQLNGNAHHEYQGKVNKTELHKNKNVNTNNNINSNNVNVVQEKHNKMGRRNEAKQGKLRNSIRSRASTEHQSDVASYDYNSLPCNFNAKSTLEEITKSGKRDIARLVNVNSSNQVDITYDTQSLPVDLVYRLSKGKEVDAHVKPARNVNEEQITALRTQENNLLEGNTANDNINKIEETTEPSIASVPREKDNKLGAKQSANRQNVIYARLRINKSREASPRRVVEGVTKLSENKSVNKEHSSQASPYTHHRLRHVDSPMISARARAESHLSENISSNSNSPSSRNRISPRRVGRPSNGILPPITLNQPHINNNSNNNNNDITSMKRIKNIDNNNNNNNNVNNATTSRTPSERSESEVRTVIELSAELESVVTDNTNATTNNNNNNNNNSNETLSNVFANVGKVVSPKRGEHISQLEPKEIKQTFRNGNATNNNSINLINRPQEMPSANDDNNNNNNNNNTNNNKSDKSDKNKGNANMLPTGETNQVIRLQRALQSREAMVEKMRLKEKSWAEQVKQLKVELRNAREKERRLNRHMAGQKPLPQLIRPYPPVRRAETAPDGSDMIFDPTPPASYPHPPSTPLLLPPSNSSNNNHINNSNNNNSNSSNNAHPLSVGLPNRIKATRQPANLNQRRGRVKLDFSKAHIFTPDTFRPITAPDFPEEVYNNDLMPPLHPRRPPQPPLKLQLNEQQRQPQQSKCISSSNTTFLSSPETAAADIVKVTNNKNNTTLNSSMSTSLRKGTVNQPTIKKKNGKIESASEMSKYNGLQWEREYEQDDNDDVNNFNSELEDGENYYYNNEHEEQSWEPTQRGKRHIETKESWLPVDDSFKLSSLNTQQTALGLPKDAALRPVPIEFKHLLQFVVAQVITHEQAKKLWKFWCELKLVNQSSTIELADTCTPSLAEQNKKDDEVILDVEPKENNIRECKSDAEEEHNAYATERAQDSTSSSISNVSHMQNLNNNTEKVLVDKSDKRNTEISNNKKKKEECKENEGEKDMEIYEEEEEEEEEEYEESESESEAEKTEEEDEREEEEIEESLEEVTAKKEEKKQITEKVNEHKGEAAAASDVATFDVNLLKTQINRNAIFTPTLRQKIDTKFTDYDAALKSKRDTN